jgi:type I restriction enzyme R subunit
MKLPKGDGGGSVDVDDDVALAYYRLDRINTQDILLTAGEPPVGLKGLTDVGTRRAEDKEVQLSELIQVLNERFGTEFKEADRLFFEEVVAQAKEDPDVRLRAEANAFDNFALSMRQKFEDAMVDRMERNESIVSRFLNDPEFRELISRELARRIYGELRAGGTNTGGRPDEA